MGDAVEGSAGQYPVRRGLYRRRSGEGRRPHQTLVRMNDDEYARVVAMAKVAKISLPRLFMRSVLVGDVATAAAVEHAVAELHILQRVMGGAARNLNQIARAANAGGEVHEDQVLAAADAILRQSEKLRVLLAEIPGGELYR